MEDHRLEDRLEALHPQSFAWAVRCCAGDREEAEDVLQATYLKIVEGRARHRGEASLKTWLFAVIRNTAASRRRRSAAVRRLSALLARREPRPAAPDPERLVAASEDKLRLRRALACLAPRQRELLELLLDHELSLREAAEVMGVSVGTARRHYDRAKRALARDLAPEACAS